MAMAMTVKLPRGEAQVTESVTLRLPSGAQVTAENMSVREAAHKDWETVVDLIDSLSASYEGDLFRIASQEA
jgi:hypothetical protein